LSDDLHYVPSCMLGKTWRTVLSLFLIEPCCAAIRYLPVTISVTIPDRPNVPDLKRNIPKNRIDPRNSGVVNFGPEEHNPAQQFQCILT